MLEHPQELSPGYGSADPYQYCNNISISTNGGDEKTFVQVKQKYCRFAFLRQRVVHDAECGVLFTFMREFAVNWKID